MGAELVRIKDKNLYCVLDNTLDEVKTFGDFEGCVKAFKHFGRTLGYECQEDYVIEFFENEMTDIFEKEQLDEELKKIKEYFE